MLQLLKTRQAQKLQEEVQRMEQGLQQELLLKKQQWQLEMEAKQRTAKEQFDRDMGQKFEDWKRDQELLQGEVWRLFCVVMPA